MRQALERIIQQGKGGLVVLGHNHKVSAASSGGFRLENAGFSPARISELSKMDGGIVLDDSWATILEANVHFIPDGSIPTDETGARHRTAERLSVETGKPVVAVSEGRKVATLFYLDEKLELAQPTEVAAHINQELQSLDRLRSRLDEAQRRLTRLEVTGFSTYRPVVTVIQRAALVEKLGRLIKSRSMTLGDEDRIVTLQLNDLLSGVDRTMRLVLQDYLKPLRSNSVQRAVDAIEGLAGSEIDDPVRVGKVLGFPDLDDPAEARGHRVLSYVGRLPDSVREDIVRHFGSVTKLLRASEKQLTVVEGVGDTRALQLTTFFARISSQAQEWETHLA
jgi:diadenylate cyclase